MPLAFRYLPWLLARCRRVRTISLFVIVFISSQLYSNIQNHYTFSQPRFQASFKKEYFSTCQAVSVCCRIEIGFSHYRKNKNAVQIRKRLYAVYGENVLTKRQCQNWFSKFLSCNFDLKAAPRSARPVEADEHQINTLVDANRRITTRDIAGKLNLHNRIKPFFSIKKKENPLAFPYKERNYFTNNHNSPCSEFHSNRRYFSTRCNRVEVERIDVSKRRASRSKRSRENMCKRKETVS